MGLFGFGKKKKQEPIKFDEIDDWLDNYVEKQEIGVKIGILRREIRAKIVRMEEKLLELEKAELKDDSIVPEREKNVLDGNKKAYVQKIRLFLGDFKVPENYAEVKKFLEDNAEKLENLATDTQKNFYILKQFMEDEVRPVSTKLSEFDKLIATTIETLDKTALQKVKTIREHIKDYYHMKTEIQQIRKEAETIEKIKLELYEKRDKVESKLKKLKKSGSFVEYEELKEKEKEFMAKLSRQKKAFTAFISDIDAAVKKFAKQSGDKELNDLLKDPIETLLKDRELKLIEKFQTILKKINELELKDSKKKRIENSLKEFTKEELEKLRNNIIKFKEEIDNLKRRIKNHSAGLNIKEEEGWLENLDGAIAKEDFKMQEIENRLERLNPNLIKQKIKKFLKELDERVELE